MNRTEKLIFLSLMAAMAIVLGLFEKTLPVPFLGPGAKLGLANVVTVVALYQFRFSEVLAVILTRIVMLSLLGGTMSGFFYSLAGGLLSFIVMYLLLKVFSKEIGTIGLSVAGAVAHNVGQIAIASLVVENIKMVFYLPILLAAGVGTGIFIGLTAQLLLLHLKKLSFAKA